jgi:hypothetical protein
MTTSEGRLHYLTWVILPSPLVLTCDVRTLNATEPGRECLEMLLRFQLDSDVCSADLHHNPRKHVGLHAPQRLHRLP